MTIEELAGKIATRTTDPKNTQEVYQLLTEFAEKILHHAEVKSIHTLSKYLILKPD